MDHALFEDPAMYGQDDRQRGAMRAFALGGVLQLLRASRGWSVEQAAVHAGLGHMTWRRMEDGFTVRNKTYAAVDSLFELPFGTTKRALADDLLMVQLIARVGIDTVEVTTSTAAPFVERFARQTLSKAGKQTVQARAGVALGSGHSSDVERQRAIRQAVERNMPPIQPPRLPVSDLEAVASVLDRITRRHLTPRLDKAVRALLDAMPDLIERSLVDQSETLPANSAAPLSAELAEQESAGTDR